MPYFVLTFLSIALLLAIAALARERRLRRALQLILRRLLERLKPDETPNPTHPAAPANVPDDRLQQQ